MSGPWVPALGLAIDAGRHSRATLPGATGVLRHRRLEFRWAVGCRWCRQRPSGPAAG